MPETELSTDPPPEILPEAVAKRRLAIYTLFRVAGLVLLGAGVLGTRGGVGVVDVVLIIIGAAGLFARPRHVARLFGSRW